MYPRIARNAQIVLSLGFILVFFALHTCEKVEPAPLLLVSTDTIADITLDGLFVEGTILHVGEEGITQHGFCWSSSGNPTVDLETKTQLGSRNSAGSFNGVISGLAPNTTYSIKAYATDEKGSIYGEAKTFTTLALTAPEVVTVPVTEIELETAQSGGNITYSGGSAILSRGVCWSTTQNPSILNNYTEDGTGDGVYESEITRLDCGTTYYVRAYATNEVGTAYGAQLEFKTLECPVGLPEVLTSAVSDITETTASGGGEVIDQGSSGVTSRGVCWSTAHNPVLSDHHTINGGGEGVYTSSLSGLSCGTNYYIRAYATNGSGTSYGPLDSFQTVQCPVKPPEVETGTITNITRISAQGGGNVLSDGGAEVTSKGICWGTSPDPALGNNYTVNGGGSGSFISQMTGLECGTLYYVRAYATNSEGTSYGNQLEFTTEECQFDRPVLTTTAVSNITLSSAQSGGNISTDGGAPVTAKGICWSTFENPTISHEHTDEGEGLGEFTSVMTGLECDTRYYVRAYATNSEGTSYGQQEDFRTSLCQNPPTVSTKEISDLRETTLSSGGEVTDDGNQPVTARGVCWSTSPQPTIENDKTLDGSDLGSFDSQVSGLSPKTTYYLRAYATNSVGTGYGEEKEFTTWEGSVTDYDGNIYPTVSIGEQTWMQENLKVSHFPDGTPVPLASDYGDWQALGFQGKGYTWYRNEIENLDTYGALYSWSAAANGSLGGDDSPSGIQGVCPDGWHLPSSSEWIELELFLGMDPDDAYYAGNNERGSIGGKLKQEGTSLWNSPNVGATNESGFTALPGGIRDSIALYSSLGNSAYFWTSESHGEDMASFRQLLTENTSIAWQGQFKNYGLSVRCVKNE